MVILVDIQETHAWVYLCCSAVGLLTSEIILTKTISAGFPATECIGIVSIDEQGELLRESCELTSTCCTRC